MENTLSDLEQSRVPNAEEKVLLGKMDNGVQYVFMGQPIALDDNRVVTTHDIAAGAMSIAAQPDVPRNLNFVLTDANDSVTATIVIVGVDSQGRIITETAQITLGTGKTWTGTKLYAFVTSITVSALSGEAGGDAIIVGVGNVIGLPFDIDHVNAVNRAYVGGTLVTPDAITIDENSGVDCNAATYDGTKVLMCIVRAHQQS